ncbi:hypothetical protein [Mycobacterium sp.]|uniref:hypothetical protein n=1 Tax=Mycobacterium sp. TaxID=1785 RepID=UPI0012808DAC|nr:hypothetical protein [Mycobacterium sp.]KAA8962460.1 MAG: PE family protein [Mycobacterium sp.]
MAISDRQSVTGLNQIRQHMWFVNAQPEVLMITVGNLADIGSAINIGSYAAIKAANAVTVG